MTLKEILKPVLVSHICSIFTDDGVSSQDGISLARMQIVNLLSAE